jgi:hypothetical protein
VEVGRLLVAEGAVVGLAVLLTPEPDRQMVSIRSKWPLTESFIVCVHVHMHGLSFPFIT